MCNGNVNMQNETTRSDKHQIQSKTLLNSSLIILQFRKIKINYYAEKKMNYYMTF